MCSYTWRHLLHNHIRTYTVEWVLIAWLILCVLCIFNIALERLGTRLVYNYDLIIIVVN